MRLPSPNRRADPGFSLVEMLVVAGIIVLLSAVALPQISRYIRNYKIRGAAQQIADQLQMARSKAIMKNVQLGTIWLPQSASSAWAIEDDTQKQVGTSWYTVAAENLTNVLADPAQSAGFVPLPDWITFDNPANCPGGTAANAWGIRFNNLGAMCQVGTTNCAAPAGLPSYTSTNRVAFSGGSATICVLDSLNNLRRRVIVTSGGRVLIQ